jgi:Domain of unknown function (DUF4383)
MKAPGFARVIGVLFLVVGALGFVPWATSPAPLSAEYINLAGHYGFLFGAFAVNDAHDLIHVFIGGWGILASFAFKSSVLYLRVVACLYLLLTVLGVIPITNTLFGAVPIYGWDIALHFIVAAIALYGGFGAGAFREELPAF